MRILIDLQGAQTESRFRGIGRYALALAQALARNADGHEIWLALNLAFPDSIAAIRRSFAGLVPAERIRLFDIPLPVAARQPANAWRACAAAAIRADFLRRLRPDAILATSFFEGWLDDAAVAVNAIGPAQDGPRTAIVLYDLIPWGAPATYLAEPGQLAWYEGKLAGLKQAGLLLAISDHTRGEAMAVLGLPPERVSNIGAAADPRFRPGCLPPSATAALCARLGIVLPFVLCAPGGFDERKNIDGLITAWGLLAADLRRSHQLVIVSKLGADMRQRLEQCAARAGLAAGELILAGYVEDDALAALYGATALFVFPSRQEGFGLPVLEAMSCGAPVIGADSSSIPEIIGRADALFDAADPAAICACISAVLRDPARRADLCAHGLRQAAKFSWDATARLALSAIEARFAPGASTASTPSVAAAPMRPPHDIAQDLVDALAAISATPAGSDLIQAADCLVYNHSCGSARQLLLDISEIVKKDARSGIQRVVRSLLAELLDRAPSAFQVRPIYFDGVRYRHAHRFIEQRMAGGRTNADHYAGPATDPAADTIIEYFQDDIYLALDLNAMSAAAHACQQRLRRRGVHMHFVVYDILLLHHPEWWPAGYAATFEDWLRKIVAVADSLICISAAVAADLRDWLATHVPQREHALRISSFHLGADIARSLPSRGLPADAIDLLARLAVGPSFLMVGTLEPRKGHAQALAAFELLWARGKQVNLVMVGKQGWMVDALAERLRSHPEQGRRLFWLAGISDEYLEKLYAASSCLLAASEGEGFGLPLIEAAMRRLPILARDIAVFREVAGAHASYFSGLAATDLAGALEAWLDSADSMPRPDAMPWLTWRESAGQLLAHLNLPGSAAAASP